MRAPQAVRTVAYGVADGSSMSADDGGTWFYTQLKGANLTEDEWELQWDPSQPTAIAQLPLLQRAAPVAQAAGVRVALVLDSARPSSHDPNAFCAWAALVAATAKQWGIHDFIVWNEPNTVGHWAPQGATAPARYEALLARCYDAIHAADPQARVIGFALSPRANAPTETAPIPFIAGVGAAYRASGRTRPIMDQMSLHPYPSPSSPTDSPDVGYASPQDYGVPNLDRVKQAVWDAFQGTGQPTTLNGLTFRIDELGWQTTTVGLEAYSGEENAGAVSELTQAAYIAEAVQKYLACDPTVTDVDWSLLVDEPGGGQSGLMTAGGEGVSQPKVAYTADARLFAEGRAACARRLAAWAPTTSALSPYRAGARGIDVSYPNCGVRLTGVGEFGVVGVNGGRPFTFNPCLRREYAHYTGSAAAALYLNTGYEPRFLGRITPACAAAGHGRPPAYAVGCSEAAISVGHLRGLGLPQPRVWWLDVETSNRWSPERAVNTWVLRGMMDYLKTSTTAAVGVYSMRPWWHRITTGWRVTAPEWIPSIGSACPAPFSAGPVWLAQTGSAVLDVDVACG